MRTRDRRRAAPPLSPRAAFTLIELLVTMTILVILSALVIVAFQPENDDRVSASARTVQSYLEGAKSRAISEQQPIGVRLIPSQNDRRVVDSLQYIAGNSQLEGTLAIAWDPPPPAGTGPRWLIANSLTGQWTRLNVGGRNLIQPGKRIEIPAGTGNWYTLAVVEDADMDGILDANENDGANPPFDNQNNRLDVVVYNGTVDIMSIHGHYQLSTWNAGAYEAQPSIVPYRLELAASTLPDSDPVQLERGTVIDVDASQVPATWRGGAPMDIMFDARGNPTGGLVAQGLIHLYITTVGDVELARLLGGVRHPAGGGGGCTGVGDYVVPLVPANPPNTPETEPRIVTLFTQTGQVMRSQVNFTDTRDNCDPTVTTPDLIADNPYAHARRGREAQ